MYRGKEFPMGGGGSAAAAARVNDTAVTQSPYEEFRRQSFLAFEEIDGSDAVNRSLEFSLSNTSRETDYESWSEGSKRFADDNYEALKKWVN
jgi:hypothetical protein